VRYSGVGAAISTEPCCVAEKRRQTNPNLAFAEETKTFFTPWLPLLALVALFAR
jgi:hypothetical protein